MRAPRARRGDSGITLIEVMVSLALFSLIGMAGFGVVDSVLRAQRHTDGRLERLGQMQRAMHLLTLDFEQVADRILDYDGDSVRFRRLTATGPVDMVYRAGDGTLQRVVDGRRAQTVLAGVSEVRWRFLDAQGGWLDIWPSAGTGGGPDVPTLPGAVAVEMVLEGDGLSGALRRVVRLPRGGE